MDVGQFLVSLVGGGLAGGCASVISGRVFHWRTLRTQFHPILNHFWGAYSIRIEKPEGRHLTTIVGKTPPSEETTDSYDIDRVLFTSLFDSTS